MSTGPFCFLWGLAAAATIVVAIVTAVVTAAGQNEDQDYDPPAAVTAEEAVVVTHNGRSSFQCSAQTLVAFFKDFCFVFMLFSVLSTLHHIAKEQIWLQLFLR